MEELKGDGEEKRKERELPSLEEFDLTLLHPRARAKLERSLEAEHMSHDQKQRLSHLSEVRFDEPMKNHIGFRVGGNVEAFVTIKQMKGLRAVMEFANDENISFVFVGHGRNMIVRDGGLRGMAICFGGEFCRSELIHTSDEGFFFSLHAAVSWNEFARFAEMHELPGFAKFQEIPGTVAGSLQSGSLFRHFSLASSLEEVTILNSQLKELTLRGKSLRFEGGKLKLPHGSALLRMLLKFPRQPEREPSPSLRPERDVLSLAPFFDTEKMSAGQLIADAGLQGVRVGGARVSLHAPDFLVNEGEAKARDVMVLVGLIKDRVKSQSGITLEQKIMVIGHDT